MTAFVPAVSSLSLKSTSFSGKCALQKSTKPWDRFPTTVASKTPAKIMLSMSMDDGDTSVQDSPVDYDETKLFVGNLAWATTEESLKEAFSRYGQVIDARVITDRYTGRSRGFGFIEYDAASEASEALEAMNGADIDGRNVRVDRASRQRPFRTRNEFY